MPRRAITSRLDRLEQLKGLLRARDHITAAELCEQLDVSMRTVRRDIEILRDTGIPVESDRGRGGGLRLARNWALGRLQLSHHEAIDLLLSLAIAERMNSPILLQHVAAIKRKIAAAFGESHQRQITSLRSRILLGKPASHRVASSYVPKRLSALAEAFVNMRCISIDYADRAGRISTRDVEPQFLYLSVPVWYLLAWDRLRSAPRSFRVDRIRNVVLLDTFFRGADPKPFIAEVEHGIAAI
jgi:predicted DNA-binding transcriptional regulator YafY